jgi:hypothetical protein
MEGDSERARPLNSSMSIWPTKCLLLVVYCFDTDNEYCAYFVLGKRHRSLNFVGGMFAASWAM